MVNIKKGGFTMTKKGVMYLGSEAVQTSIANKEILPKPPKNWTMGYHLYKFSIMNYSDCTLVINNKAKLFLRANQGFNSDSQDASISSVKIVESGVEFNWIGAY